MICIKISPEFATLVPIDSLLKEILGKTIRECDTPGIKDLKNKAYTEFVNLLKIEAEKNNSEIIFHNENWVHVSKSGEKISMPPGYYITSNDGVFHQVTPSY